MKRKLFLSTLLLAAIAGAAPAPWWLWESVTGSGAKVCSQTPLGPGWRKLLGPYKDSRCEKLIRVQ
ncbi:hypothetical protein [Pseudoduganella lutea]|uniref:Secreted protein n=1 Tax=Pseudoduganella lutea TaxID=321985 RepID=A0A4P6KS93_9BURK|nr:hypothetical protein [Pseudoduganella lutea]QBE61979.1 hypothetical protein EWM63_02405 [Pseudoduganella lutea]